MLPNYVTYRAATVAMRRGAARAIREIIFSNIQSKKLYSINNTLKISLKHSEKNVLKNIKSRSCYKCNPNPFVIVAMFLTRDTFIFIIYFL